MTIAELVRNVAQNALATAFNQGYAVNYDGSRTSIPIGQTLKETRNKDGRCTLYRVQYEDGSTLTMRWTETHGYTWRTV